MNFRPDGVGCEAVMSRDGLYRYTLTRMWDEFAPTVTWIMLNPSTADDKVDDATIKRVIAFGKRWGCGTATVVNLFPFRATDPKDLKKHDEPDRVFKTNVDFIEQYTITNKPEYVICAWGVHGAFRRRAVRVATMLRDGGADLYALKVTETGQPCHPLYLPGDLKPQPWTGKAY